MPFDIRDLNIVGFGICRASGTNPIRILRDDCTFSFLLERNPQLSLATRGEDWASQGQPKGEEGNPAGLSSCSGGLRPLVELCVEPVGLCGRCTGHRALLLSSRCPRSRSREPRTSEPQGRGRPGPRHRQRTSQCQRIGETGPECQASGGVCTRAPVCRDSGWAQVGAFSTSPQQGGLNGGQVSVLNWVSVTASWLPCPGRVE